MEMIINNNYCLSLMLVILKHFSMTDFYFISYIRVYNYTFYTHTIIHKHTLKERKII